MERLTFEGNFCDIAQCREYSCLYNDACSARKVWERLKAYEDTGLEPEEVFPKDKADEIALKLMRLADLESICSYTRLRELAETDKDGRLVILPCKVGDTVYDVDFGRISSHFIRKIEWNKQGGFARCAFLLPFDDFGKTVFLTKEEAEKALEGMKDD